MGAIVHKKLIIISFTTVNKEIIIPTERRKVFSSSSEFGLLLLKQVVVDVFSKADKLRDVYTCFSSVRRYVVHAIDGLKH